MIGTMPSTVISSISGWGAYFASGLILVVVLTPAVYHVHEASKVESGLRIIAGVQRVLDSLRPGLVATLTYGSLGGAAEVRTGAHAITYISGNTSVSAETKWALQNSTLNPGLNYSVYLAGGLVEVSRVGGS